LKSLPGTWSSRGLPCSRKDACIPMQSSVGS
jgi:hypothetical protein